MITDKGMVIVRPRTTDYYGMITGIPSRTGPRRVQADEAPPETKAAK